jgi:DNA-binding NarL/FixJ family response regulator
MAIGLLADSQPLFNEALEALLSRGAGHQVIGRCSSAEDAFAYVSNLRPDLVLVDATLGLGGCANLVTRMLEVCPEARVMVLGDDHDADLLLAAIRSGVAGVVGNTYGAGTVLRVAGAVLEGEGAVPRGMLLELTRRTVSRNRTPDLPLVRLSPASARCSPCSAEAGTTAGSRRSCSSASTPWLLTSRTSWRARNALKTGSRHLRHAVNAARADLGRAGLIVQGACT